MLLTLSDSNTKPHRVYSGGFPWRPGFGKYVKFGGLYMNQINLPVDGKNQGGGVGLATLPLLVIPKTGTFWNPLPNLLAIVTGASVFLFRDI